MYIYLFACVLITVLHTIRRENNAQPITPTVDTIECPALYRGVSDNKGSLVLRNTGYYCVTIAVGLSVSLANCTRALCVCPQR